MLSCTFSQFLQRPVAVFLPHDHVHCSYEARNLLNSIWKTAEFSASWHETISVQRFLLFAIRKKGRKKTALGLFIMLLHVCVSLYVTYVTVTSICRHCELVRCQIHNVGEVGYFLSENNGIVSADELLLGYCGSYLKESLHPSLSSSSLLHSLVNCLHEFMITFFLY